MSKLSANFIGWFRQGEIRHYIWIMLGVIVGIVLASILWSVLQIGDWTRGLL